MRGSPPPNTSLFTLKYFSNFNYLFYGFCVSGVILKELGQNVQKLNKKKQVFLIESKKRH